MTSKIYRKVTDAEVINYLTIDCGFSRYNAEIALQLYKEGKLEKYEYIFNKIYNYTPEGTKLSYWYPISSALNYEITTQHDGRATNRQSR